MSKNVVLGRRHTVAPVITRQPYKDDPTDELSDPRALAKAGRASAVVPTRSTGAPVGPGPAVPEGPATLNDLADRLAHVEALLQKQLVAQMPLTGFDAGLDGSTLGSTIKYVLLYKNRKGHAISVKVSAVFSTVGARVKVSLRDDLSDLYRIDELANSALPPNGTTTERIPLKPEAELYLALAAQPDGSVIPLAAADRFRVFEYDPEEL